MKIFKKKNDKPGSGSDENSPLESKEIKIPETKNLLEKMKKDKEKKKRRICECGNPTCTSPITNPTRWKWVYIDE